MGGDRLAVTVRNQNLSAAFVALVLAMTLLGPLPAMTIGVVVVVVDARVRGLSWARWINNLATYSVFPVAGGLLARSLLDVHDPASAQASHSVEFALIVFGVFIVHEPAQLRNDRRLHNGSSAAAAWSTRPATC